MYPDLPQRLTKAIEFQLATDFILWRGPSFGESYLTKVCADFLGQLGRSPDGCFLPVAEFPLTAAFPRRPGATGSNPSIDFALCPHRNDAAQPYGDPRLGVEVKWADSVSCNERSVTADLLRLAALATRFQCEGLVILGGTRQAIRDKFENSVLFPPPAHGFHAAAETPFQRRFNLETPRSALRPVIDSLRLDWARYPGIRMPRTLGFTLRKSAGFLTARPSAFVAVSWHLRFNPAMPVFAFT